jgi:importin-5
MLDTLPPLAQSLSQPSLGSNSSSGSTPRTSNYHYLSTFLSVLTPLCTSHPSLFSPHLVSLLTFLPTLILPPVDCGPTPTIGRPFPGNGGINNVRQGAFVFPPHSESSGTSISTSSFPSFAGSSDSLSNQNSTGDDEKDDERDERSTLRLSALEFMISLSEAKPNMVRKVPGWTDIIVRACLEGMGEFDEDETDVSGLEGWLREDVGFVFLLYQHI